jgi:membrane-bound metal-dependent hydrolase YbcI (DUF457 family)
MALFFLPILLVTRHYRLAPQRIVILAFLVVASHIVLDFSGLTPILWPIYPYDISVRFALNIVLGNGVGLPQALRWQRLHPTSAL